MRFMKKSQFEKLKSKLNEAIKPVQSSDFIIQKLADGEKPPMQLLLEADPSEKSIMKYLEQSDVYVALENDNIIGVYVLTEIAPRKAELMNIAVEQSHQGRGIGKVLVRHAIENAKTRGMDSIELGTGNSSIQQLALYQKCGFRMHEIIHDYFVDHYDEPIFENGIQCRDMVRLIVHL